jgi:hypothetical protein
MTDETERKLETGAEAKKRAEQNRLRALAIRERRRMERDDTAAADLLALHGTAVASQPSTACAVSSSSAFATSHRLQLLLSGDPTSAGGFFSSDPPAALSTPSAETSKKRRYNFAEDATREDLSEKNCESCGCMSEVCKEFSECFGISVCKRCRATNDDYALLCKSDVQTNFLLPEGTIAVLRYLERRNPKHPGFTSMRMFLKAQVREKAYIRFGGPEGLEAEKTKRNVRKWQTTLLKTKEVFSSDSSGPAL